MIKNFFIRKYSISLLNEKWETIIGNIRLRSLPRKGEFVYWEKDGETIYYEVLNLVHYLNGKQGIFLLVKRIT